MDLLIFPPADGRTDKLNYNNQKQLEPGDTKKFTVTVSWTAMKHKNRESGQVEVRQEEGHVDIKNVTAHWTLAYFAHVLSAAIREGELLIFSEQLGHQSFVCVTKGGNTVLSIMKPTNPKRFCTDPTSLGEFGVLGKSELRLVTSSPLKDDAKDHARAAELERLDGVLGPGSIRVMSDATCSLERSIALLEDQYAAFVERQDQCESLLKDLRSSKGKETQAKHKEEGTGPQLREQCARVVQSALMNAAVEASKAYVTYGNAGPVDHDHVAIRFQGRWHQVKVVKKRGDNNTLPVPKTCGDVAARACKYFEQRSEGVMLHELPPQRTRDGKSDDDRQGGSKLAIWPNSYLILNAIEASTTRYFGLRIAPPSQSDETVAADAVEDAVEETEEDAPLTRLRRRRERMEWIVVMFMMLFTVILNGLGKSEMEQSYQFNQAMQKMLHTITINDQVFKEHDAGNPYMPENTSLNTLINAQDIQMPIELLEMLSAYYKVTDNSYFPKFNRIAKYPAATQYRSIPSTDCHATQILNPFQLAEGGYVEFEPSPMTSVSCQAFYSPTNQNAAPFWNFTAPFLFARETQMSESAGQFGAYGISGFPMRVEYLQHSVEQFSLNGCVDSASPKPSGCYEPLFETWIDDSTRAVIVTYAVYNKNLNMVEKSTVIVELTLSGSMRTTQKGVSAVLHTSIGTRKVLIFAIINICIIALVYIDVTTVLWVLVAPSKDPKAWISFLFFDSIQSYMNIAIYCMFVFIMIMDAERVAVGARIFSFMEDYLDDCTSISCPLHDELSTDTFDKEFAAYLDMATTLKQGEAIFLTIMWGKMALQVVTGFPLLFSLAIRLAFKIVSFMIVMGFITGGVLLLLYSAYGDYLTEASTPAGSVVLSLLVYVGTYDFAEMKRIDSLVTLIVLYYLFLFPLLLYNLSISVMVVELPWVLRNLQATKKAIKIKFTSDLPGKCVGCSCKGGTFRFPRFKKGRKGYCGCCRIEGNSDLENPVIWAIEFARTQNENGEYVKQTSCDKFWNQFLPGYRLKPVVKSED